MSLFEELRRLEEEGIDLIEVLGQDSHLRSPSDLQSIVERFWHSGENIYVELLHFLTYRRFTEAQAEALWAAILKHRRRMEEKLGRDVRFRVAALDYLHAKTSLLKGVRLIARSEMESLLSYVVVDEVSSVYNRRCFNETLNSEVHRARRYGNPLTLLIVDLDNFKEINDRFGHLEGDYVLRQVGRLLRESTRQADGVYRFGGDEFTVILPETSNSEAFTLAERARKAVGRVIVRPSSSQNGSRAGDGTGNEPLDDENSLVLSASIGGATFPGDCEETEELVRIADQLCLEAKRGGKNRVVMSGDRKNLTSE